METFDTVNKATIVNSQGLHYIEFRNQLAPKYTRVWVDIMAGHFTLVIVLLAAVLMQKTYPQLWWLTILAGGLLAGYMVAYLNLFMHEASHYNIAGNKKLNDLLANIFIGLLIGMDIGFYRRMHFVHHRYLGTKKDSEKSYFEAITPRFIIESFMGVRILKVLAHRNKDMKMNEGESEGHEIIRKNNLVFFAAASLNLGLIITFFVLGYWQVSLLWLVGMGVSFPFFASFRQVLEHRRADADQNINYNEVDHGVVHRMFGDGPIAWTMGPAGFNRHLIHHWDPQVSYTRFKEIEIFLQDTPLNEELQRCQTTYFKTFVGLLKG